MNTLAVGAISLYQRHISPYKGFRCAHRALRGGWSCSEFGKRAFARVSVNKAYALLKRRLAACRTIYQEWRVKSVSATATDTGGEGTEAGEPRRRRRSSRLVDYCDCGTSGCDGVSIVRPGARGVLDACGDSACSVDLLPCDCSL